MQQGGNVDGNRRRHCTGRKGHNGRVRQMQQICQSHR